VKFVAEIYHKDGDVAKLRGYIWYMNVVEICNVEKYIQNVITKFRN